ncbi:serine/threonine-protein kinase [Nonomuraea africana]|uniref:serine/threonine-protein kinase n=1 Tax=Nonomuraea africana TaxID=46171 RepID=UPI0033C4BEC9
MSDHVETLSGRYRLLRPLGQGGMGRVWHAHDELLARDVAAKEVLPPIGLGESEIEVFTIRTLREARAAARISHPGVAAVYDVLEEHGHPWIIMQFVPSRPLGDVIAERGGLPPERVARIGLDVLRALRAAHAVGVLHRDVKPDNVLLAHDGTAVLTDFGLAALDEDASVTRSGMVVGTPAYMAPERATGGPSLPASDLWSLGAMLYAAVEGASPFHRSHVLATLGAVVHDDPPPSARTGALAPVIHGLLRKEPSERLDLDEAETLLRAAAQEPPLHALPLHTRPLQTRPRHATSVHATSVHATAPMPPPPARSRPAPSRPAPFRPAPARPAASRSLPSLPVGFPQAPFPSVPGIRPRANRLFPVAVAALIIAALAASPQSGGPSRPSPVAAPPPAAAPAPVAAPAVRHGSPAPAAATSERKRQDRTMAASPRRITIAVRDTDRQKAHPGKGGKEPKRDKTKGKGRAGR